MLLKGILMRQIKLLTSSLEFVTHVDVPDFSPMPNAIVWGERIFLLRPNVPDHSEYVEGFTYFVPPTE